MMKNFYILFISIMLVLSSCNKFLDIKPDAKLQVPKTLDDAQALLDDVLRMVEQTVPARGEDIVDDYYISENTYNSISIDQRNFYKWDYPEYFGVANDWGAAYAPVYNANLALEILNKIERNNENLASWDNVKGSALFYRAFYFFKLLVVYSPAFDDKTADTDIGVVLRIDTDFNKLSTRASVKDSYDRIFKDLYDAIKYLPDYSLHVTRPSKAAVYALLSNIYHYRGEYQQSLNFADLALSLNDKLIDLNGDDNLGNMSTVSTPFLKYNKETIFYAELTNAVVFSRSRAIIDSNILKMYDKNDLRTIAFFRVNSGNFYYKGSLTGVDARFFGGLSTSEMYLNKAESLAKLDRINESIITLNLLLKKRLINGSTLLNPNSLNKINAIKVIRDERRKELLYRGIRLADLKRYNIEGENISIIRKINGIDYILEPNSSKYNLPLPADLVKFTGMQQN